MGWWFDSDGSVFAYHAQSPGFGPSKPIKPDVLTHTSTMWSQHLEDESEKRGSKLSTNVTWEPAQKLKQYIPNAVLFWPSWWTLPGTEILVLIPGTPSVICEASRENTEIPHSAGVAIAAAGKRSYPSTSHQHTMFQGNTSLTSKSCFAFFCLFVWDLYSPSWLQSLDLSAVPSHVLGLQVWPPCWAGIHIFRRIKLKALSNTLKKIISQSGCSGTHL